MKYLPKVNAQMIYNSQGIEKWLLSLIREAQFISAENEILKEIEKDKDKIILKLENKLKSKTIVKKMKK